MGQLQVILFAIVLFENLLEIIVKKTKLKSKTKIILSIFL